MWCWTSPSKANEVLKLFCLLLCNKIQPVANLSLFSLLLALATTVHVFFLTWSVRSLTQFSPNRTILVRSRAKNTSGDNKRAWFAPEAYQKGTSSYLPQVPKFSETSSDVAVTAMKYVRHSMEWTSTSQQTARKDDEGRKRMRKIFSDWVLLQYITNKVINCGWTFMPRKCFTNLITRKQTRRKLQNANHFEACHSLYSTWSEWHEYVIHLSTS